MEEHEYEYMIQANLDDGDIETALKYANEGLKAYPDYPLLYSYRAIVFDYEKEYKNAIEDLTVYLTFFPDDASKYYYRGTIYCANNQYDEALNDFTTAIQLDSCSRYYFQRGCLHFQLENKSSAESDLHKAIEINRPVDNYYVTLSRELLKKL